MRKRMITAGLVLAFATAAPAAAVAAQVEFPGTNNAPGSSDCHTNGINTPPGANGLCK